MSPSLVKTDSNRRSITLNHAHHSTRRLRDHGIVVPLLLICAVQHSASAQLFDPESPYANLPPASAFDQPEAKLPQQRSRRSFSNGAYKLSITPHWFAENTRFWYRNDLRDNQREFILVDAAAGKRTLAFDHERLAESLRTAGIDDARPEKLPIESLEFDDEARIIKFRVGEQGWRCDLQSYRLEKVERDASSSNQLVSPLGSGPRASTRTGGETHLTFVNKTQEVAQLIWLDGAGRPRSYGRLAPRELREQHTFAGHVWQVVGPNGAILGLFRATERPQRVEITGTGNAPRRRARFQQPNDTSPDGKWQAFIRDHDVYLRSTVDNEEVRLSHDGSEEQAYDRLEWSPDSATLVGFRIAEGDRHEVHLVESSPTEGGRARLHSRPYALPGDAFTSYELNLFVRQEQLKPAVDLIDFGRPRLRWDDDGKHFSYEQVDRGHQRFRVVRMDARTGESRNIIDEREETFVWTNYRQELRPVSYLRNGRELIHASECDGWRHLYLVDINQPQSVKQITRGEWVVRGIDHIDEQQRQIWFRACGMRDDQDPYFIHYYRINFDGSGLMALTSGNGNHAVQYSPDRQYLIDTYSRVDSPPIHELRRALDGSLICRIDEADITQLTEEGWRAPEVFTAKGRDGETDIWGFFCLPQDFDPQQKYPIVEDIYAGPHDSHVAEVLSPHSVVSIADRTGIRCCQDRWDGNGESFQGFS